MNTYIVEYTDLFGGDLNYSFIERYIITAKNMRGAINKLSRHLGVNFRGYYVSNDSSIYHSKSRCTGATIDYADDLYLAEYIDNFSVEYI